NDAMHFLDILTAAEGPNDKADIHNIRVTHRNRKTAKVSQLDLGQYFERGDESLLPAVMSGDVIFVPSKNKMWLNESKDQTVRVLGAVNNQGRYRFDQSMTILDLLAQAGGLSPTASASDIVVVNAACCGDGTRKVTNFDLMDFSDSGDFSQLPELHKGDTVYVLHREDNTWNKVVDGIQETLSVLSILKIVGA
ncbi:MAG: protein involved in polysaccharide export with SLBB domain, partial [Phenylobacterium sp.]